MSGNESRIQAIYQITNREPMPPKAPKRLEDLWACDVFTLSKMQESLPKDVFKSVKKTIQTGEPLNIAIADSIAVAMKDCISIFRRKRWPRAPLPRDPARPWKRTLFAAVPPDRFDGPRQNVLRGCQNRARPASSGACRGLASG